ncbi:MAG: VOC family protein [Acidobacteriia bacterium]|nr:VOC family protein [Terriglobia bacterium]
MAIDIRGVAPLLEVFDMPASVHFYRDVLGFELVTASQAGDNFGWGLLRLHGVEVMLNTAYEEGQRPSVPDPARVAAHGDTALFFGCADLDAAYLHLRAQGCAVGEPVVTNYGMKQLSVEDPDGYHLCFQWPASQQTADQWRAWYGFDPEQVSGTQADA